MIRAGLVLIVLATGSGCASYWSNRLADLRDCAAFQVGKCRDIYFDVGVDVTPFVPVGVGFIGGPNGEARGYGFVGRNGGWQGYTAFDFPFNLFVNGIHSNEFDIGAGYYYGHFIPGWNKRRYGRVAGRMAILFGYVTFDVELIEIADLFCGFFGLDICGDDEAKPQDTEKKEVGG